MGECSKFLIVQIINSSFHLYSSWKISAGSLKEQLREFQSTRLSIRKPDVFSKAECLFGCVAFVSLVIFTFFHKIFCVLKTLNGLLASLLGQSINDYCQCCCQHQAKRGEAGLRLIVHHDEFPLISSPCKCHCTGSPKLCLLVIWLPIVFKLGNPKAVKSSVF